MSDSTPKFVEIPFDSGDNRPLPEIIAHYQGFPLTYLENNQDGQRYYLVQDWLIGVGKTDNPRRMWQNMKKRFEKAGIELSTLCGQFPYRSINGRTYKMAFAAADGLYQITQRMDVNTGIRNDVLRFLAAAGVEIDEQRIDPEKAIDAAIRAYKRQGKSDQWIEVRLMGKVQRIRFTAAFKHSLLRPPAPRLYAAITNEMRRGVWKRDTAMLKAQMGLGKKDQLRDNQPILAILYEAVAEEMSSRRLEKQNSLIYDQAKHIVRTASEFVGKQADEAGRELGVDIATDQPLLSNPKG